MPKCYLKTFSTEPFKYILLTFNNNNKNGTKAMPKQYGRIRLKAAMGEFRHLEIQDEAGSQVNARLSQINLNLTSVRLGWR